MINNDYYLNYVRPFLKAPESDSMSILKTEPISKPQKRLGSLIKKRNINN